MKLILGFCNFPKPPENKKDPSNYYDISNASFMIMAFYRHHKDLTLLEKCM
jgi:hypothetical protein